MSLHSHRPVGITVTQTLLALLVAFVALLLMREKPLGVKSGIELAREGGQA